MVEHTYLHSETTDKIIKAYYKVYNTLGYGFLEKVYEKAMMIELKASEALCLEDEAQLLNYLKATELEVGLLLNFALKPQLKRKLFTNDKKPSLNKK